MKHIDLNNEIVIYQSEDGKTQLDVKLEGETVWLNRQQLAELFDRDVKTIGKHIQACLNSAMARKGARKRTTTAFSTVRTALSASPTAPLSPSR
jgi:hypothetical protein